MITSDTRVALLNSTIKMIAENGLDKTTTKRIATDACMNEVYIYRLFNDKEDLIKEAFTALDNELVCNILSQLTAIEEEDAVFESKFRSLFLFCWKYILQNKEKCLCFIQYYYSPYFTKYSFMEHRKKFEKVIEKIESDFCEDANVWMLLNHVLNTMFNFAVKVFNGEMEDCDGTDEYVYSLVYSSIKPHLKHQPQEVYIH